MKMNSKKPAVTELVAGNGVLHRRALLGRGLALAGALGTGAGVSTGAAAEPLTEPPWVSHRAVPCRPIRCLRNSKRTSSA